MMVTEYVLVVKASGCFQLKLDILYYHGFVKFWSHERVAPHEIWLAAPFAPIELHPRDPACGL